LIRSSKPFNTDITRIKAAVPIPIPRIETPEIILIAWVDFELNRYRLENPNTCTSAKISDELAGK
jgi:hypothetical protein